MRCPIHNREYLVMCPVCMLSTSIASAIVPFVVEELEGNAG